MLLCSPSKYSTKARQVVRYKLPKPTFLSCSLSAYLTTVAKLETKHSAWLPFYITTNALVGCTLCGSNEFVPSILCHLFCFHGHLLKMPRNYSKALICHIQSWGNVLRNNITFAVTSNITRYTMK